MDARIINENLQILSKYIVFTLPAMGWYFCNTRPRNTLVFEKDKWSCMFQHIDNIAGGKQLCFSADLPGCGGAACYLGFKKPSDNAGGFLAENEKYKSCVEYGKAFYKEIQALEAKDNYIILARIQDIPRDIKIEVINLWVNAEALTGLVTLANFDRATSNNVSIPFASGCQSIWTIPYKEKNEQTPKAVVGGMDPTMRKYISPETLLFSLPSERFMELAGNVSRSFLLGNDWGNLINHSK